MYTRFIRLCLVLSFVMGILGCTILLPINITASGTSVTGKSTFPVHFNSIHRTNVLSGAEDMGVLTMSNIPKMSDRFIAHIVMTYVYSFLFYGLIIWVFKRYVAVRSAFFSENSARMYTLLVRNIPQKLLHKESLRHWFESHFKVTVLAIQFAWKTKPLDSLLKRRRNLQIKFEKEQIKAQRNRDHPTRSAFEVFSPRTKPIDETVWLRRNELITIFKEEIESLNQEISRIQNNKRRCDLFQL